MSKGIKFILFISIVFLAACQSVTQRTEFHSEDWSRGMLIVESASGAVTATVADEDDHIYFVWPAKEGAQSYIRFVRLE
jgi:hypothetical protein